MENEIAVLDEQNLLDNLGKIAYTLDRTYIEELSSDKYFCLPYKDIFGERISHEANIRACKVFRWVYNKDENPGEALKNVLGTFSNGENSIALVINRKATEVEIFFVVKNSIFGGNEQSKVNGELLRKSLIGNFQGSNISPIYKPQDTKNQFNFYAYKSVSILSNTPSKYADDYVTQGLDKIIESVVPDDDNDSYAIVFLGDSLSLSTIRETLSGYEELATAIQPYLEYQYAKGKTQTNTETESTSISKNESISNSVFKTHTINLSATLGIADSIGSTVTKGLSGLGANYAKGQTEFHGKSSGISAGYGYSWGKSKTITYGTTNTEGVSSSISLGNSETSTYTYKSYLIKNLQERLEYTMEYINKSQSNGLWKYAVYVFAKDASTSKNIASLIKATTQGKESYVSPALIQEWSIHEKEEHDNFKEIRKFVSHFIHPIFCSSGYEVKNGQVIMAENNMLVTATSLVSTDELSQVIIIPKKSMQELPVVHGTEFGREPHGIGKIVTDFPIGTAYHMYTEDKNKIIFVSKQELASHTFITGSTGSGKSNTIYQMLSKLSSQKVFSEKKDDEDKKVKFLVVEPAKGEYKYVFGNGTAHVYGTNKKLSDLLRINPFSFPSDIHILEHLDRLIEIFNVCWPMYAAMPAVLKEAVEKSYEDAGWNLTESTNPYGEDLYPTFADVARNVRTIIDSSEYDAENKGAYKGALVTRLKSLTNGINGLIFTTDEIGCKDLFDENVIVDLSRVGSAETKSLLMGLLVLKLQEYRMTSGQMNEPLKHITVLEEAHNLLKRTSTEQTSESGNLRSKSVDMLSNAIAEMRTYGEGFIIADQAPALLDMSVIRNTNTKIIMRLPDQSDRELVGKAANLNDDQITELAKLPRGVAAVYQNEWVESVLCKVEKFEDDRKFVYAEEFAKMKKKNSQTKENSDIAENMLKNRIDIAKLICSTPTEPKILKDLQDKKYKFSGTLFVNAKKYLDSPGTKPNFNNLSYIVSELLPEFTKTLKDSAVQYPSEVEIWRHDLQEHIESVLENFNMQEDMMLRNNIMQCVLQNYILNELNKPNLLKELQPKAILEMER